MDGGESNGDHVRCVLLLFLPFSLIGRRLTVWTLATRVKDPPTDRLPPCAHQLARPVDTTLFRARPHGPQTVRAMLHAGCSALPAPLSFVLTTNLPNPQFRDVICALGPCTALTALATAALSPCIAAALDEAPQARQAPRSPVSLDGLTPSLPGSGEGSGSGRGALLIPRNLGCLCTPVAAAMFLAGMLDSGWFAALEALRTADYVVTTRGAALPGSATSGPNTGATVAVR